MNNFFVVFPLFIADDLNLFTDIFSFVLNKKFRYNLRSIDLIIEFNKVLEPFLDDNLYLPVEIYHTKVLLNNIDISELPKLKNTDILEITTKKNNIAINFKDFYLETEDLELFTRRQSPEQAKKYMEYLYRETKEQNKKIEKLMDAKSYFINFLAHEIRNPISIIQSYSDLLKKEPKVIQYEELSQTLGNVTSDIKRIVDEVLDYSKLEKGMMTTSLDEVNVYNFCQRFCKNSSNLVQLKGLEWESTINLEEGFTAYLDESKVHQILHNFMNNALKFTQKGQISFQADYTEGQLLLSIQDTGKGIDKKYQNAIFEEFTQESVAIGKQYGGSGLGLNICYKLARAMNGKISCSSALNKGATFTLHIPVKVK